MSKASNVVASVTQRSSHGAVLDRVQRTPEGHMSSDGTTAQPFSLDGYRRIQSVNVCLSSFCRTWLV